MTTYGFSCVDCGRCCVHAPRLTIEEAFRFADRFLVFPVLYSGFFQKSREDAVKRIQDDKEAGLVHIVPVTGGSEDGFLSIGLCLQVYRDLATSMCPMLDEQAGKCRLAPSERPAYCRCKPLSPFILPQHYKGYKPDQTYSYCVHEPPQEGDDVFYQDGILEDSVLAKAQETARKTIASDFYAMHRLLAAILQGAFPKKTLLSIPVIYQKCMEEGSFQSPLPVDLVFTKATQHPFMQDRNKLRRFYQKQVALLTHITGTKQGNHEYQKIMKTLLEHRQTILANLPKEHG